MTSLVKRVSILSRFQTFSLFLEAKDEVSKIETSRRRHRDEFQYPCPNSTDSQTGNKFGMTYLFHDSLDSTNLRMVASSLPQSVYLKCVCACVHSSFTVDFSRKSKLNKWRVEGKRVNALTFDLNLARAPISRDMKR